MEKSGIYDRFSYFGTAGKAQIFPSNHSTSLVNKTCEVGSFNNP